MFSLSNLTTAELRNVVRLRNVDGYKNMSTQQLENIFTAPSESISTPTPVPRRRPRPQVVPASIILPISRPRTRRSPEPLPTDMN